MTQADLLQWKQPRTKRRFDGATYEPEHDDARLSAQIDRIKAVMLDGKWRTIKEIATLAKAPEPSVSAQLRHLRKARFGSYVVERMTVGNRKEGLYAYRVLPPVEGAAPAKERRTLLADMQRRLEKLEQLVRELGGAK